MGHLSLCQVIELRINPDFFSQLRLLDGTNTGFEARNNLFKNLISFLR